MCCISTLVLRSTSTKRMKHYEFRWFFPLVNCECTEWWLWLWLFTIASAYILLLVGFQLSTFDELMMHFRLGFVESWANRTKETSMLSCWTITKWKKKKTTTATTLQYIETEKYNLYQVLGWFISFNIFSIHTKDTSRKMLFVPNVLCQLFVLCVCVLHGNPSDTFVSQWMLNRFKLKISRPRIWIKSKCLLHPVSQASGIRMF